MGAFGSSALEAHPCGYLEFDNVRRPYSSLSSRTSDGGRLKFE